MIDKEAQLKNLEWMSNTLLKIASNKSLSLDQQLKLIKDLKKEYFDLKASIKLESAGGLTYPLVMDMTKEQLMALPTISQSQFDNLKFDDGKHRVWVSRMTVEDGALEDNQVHFETLQNGNWIEAALKKSKTRKCNMCKEEFDPKGSPILRCPKCFDKTSALKPFVTEPTKLLVFKREFLATPLKDQQKFGGYEISQNGKKLFKINSKDSQPMSKEQLEFCAQIELTRGFKQAKLTEKIAFLDAGTKVYILAQDKPGKRIKFASMELGLRGWAPVSKFALLSKEGEMRKHKDHIDNTYGHNGKEILVDCPNGSGNLVWLPINELLPIEAPPATPESLNPDLGLESAKKELPTKNCIHCGNKFSYDPRYQTEESAKKCQDCFGKENDKWQIEQKKRKEYEKSKKHPKNIDPTFPSGSRFDIEDPLAVPRNINDLEAEKECPDCHGNFEGAEGATCPTCGRFAIQKEALRPALAPQILNRRQEVNASGCDQCDAAMINGVFCHETGCPNAHKEWEQEQEFGNFLEGSLSKEATVVHRTDGWHVLSEKGKNLGGPYKSKAEAVKRLRQVEYFKHHGSVIRPFSKKADVLTDHVTEVRNNIEQVQQRLQEVPAIKTADATVTETEEETSTGNSLTPIPGVPPLPTVPTITNVQPTDNNNLEIPVPMPTSPPAPGQKWVYNDVDGVYVSMPDNTDPSKIV